MAKYKITALNWEETNPSFDPECGGQCNGGNYSQPRYTVIFENGIKITLYDRSCGDFGGVIHVEITRNRRTESAHYKTSNCWSDHEYSTIPRYWEPYIRAFQRELGYNEIPFKGDFENTKEPEKKWFLLGYEGDQLYKVGPFNTAAKATDYKAQSGLQHCRVLSEDMLFF